MSRGRTARRRLAAAGWLALAFACVAAGSARAASPVEDELGRSESRVRSSAFVVPAGRSVEACGLAARLDADGYARVKQRPEAPGQYFWGRERFWVYRRACRHGGDDHDAALFGLELDPGDGRIVAALDADARRARLGPGGDAWLPPVTVATSLAGDEASREPIPLAELPEHAWRAVLAAEDHRFFDHEGVDPRGVARAALGNALAGRVEQGGSTITQQLVKNRELTPKRTLGRKVSEAVRALALEAEYSKEEILAAYLDSVYLGHVGGLAVHGLGAAARAWLGKDARELTLAESALLAALIQGPNRLAPDEHPERARERRDWVLSRMAELEWIPEERARAARAQPVRVRLVPPRVPPGRAAVAWSAEVARDAAATRLDRGRGVVAETTLDAWLQREAERHVRARLAEIRDQSPRLREAPLSAAVVVMDAASGDVLALVGGNPADREDRLDRARRARRQPGSTVKPLLLLEALDRCGSQGPLVASTRVADEPLSVRVPDGTWEPQNPERTFRGPVTLRDALVDSLNVPFARVALRCGLEPCAETLRRLGLDVPEDPPPALALGAVEETPLQVARAHAALAAGGRLPVPRLVARLERPGGRGLVSFPASSTRVASEEAAWIVSDMMRDAVRDGTASAAALPQVAVAAKTGTSSGMNDAWIAGHAEGVVVVTWIGLDEGGGLGLSGAAACGPLWRDVMQDALGCRPPHAARAPDDLVVRWVNDETGLLVPDGSSRGRPELYKRGVTPRRARWWRADEPEPVLR